MCRVIKSWTQATLILWAVALVALAILFLVDAHRSHVNLDSNLTAIHVIRNLTPPERITFTLGFILGVAFLLWGASDGRRRGHGFGSSPPCAALPLWPCPSSRSRPPTRGS